MILAAKTGSDKKEGWPAVIESCMIPLGLGAVSAPALHDIRTPVSSYSNDSLALGSSPGWQNLEQCLAACVWSERRTKKIIIVVTPQLGLRDPTPCICISRLFLSVAVVTC
jgi:hypothetical protein